MGAKQHSLPAVYLGGFSDVLRPHRRESLLWVGRRGISAIFQKKAEGLCAMDDLYTLKRRPWMSSLKFNRYELDAMWLPVERRLASAIEAIISCGECFDAQTWLNTLVEFVAQTFVRGVDFGPRFVQRVVDLIPDEELRVKFKVTDSDNINAVRLIELHRLRGAVRRGHWTIVHASPGRLITNDLARTPIFSTTEKFFGYLVPLRSDAALLLSFDATDHQPMSLYAHPEDRWIIGPIKHEAATEARIAQLNGMLASSAIKEIYGAPKALVGDLHARMAIDSPPRDIVEPTLLAPFRDLGDSREFMRIVTRLATPPSQYVDG